MPPESASSLATMDDGAPIQIRRWGAPKDERVVISHGNGLAIDAFSRFGSALAERFEVVAFDMRSHGRNPHRPFAGGNWPRFIADFPVILKAIDETFGRKPTHGAFHSLSSAVCLYSSAADGYPWRSLTLFEPPVPPRSGVPLHGAFYSYHEELSQRAGRRRGSFASPDELAGSMRRSPYFNGIPAAAIDALARATLRKSDGRWTLCCPAAVEAETFRLDGVDPYRAEVSRVGFPVRIVLGDRDIHYAPILVDVGQVLCADFGFEPVRLAGLTHFMQLEAPEVCARLVAPGGNFDRPDGQNDTVKGGLG